MEGSGFRAQGAGLRVYGEGCRVQGVGLRVEGVGLRVWGVYASKAGPKKKLVKVANPATFEPRS